MSKSSWSDVRSGHTWIDKDDSIEEKTEEEIYELGNQNPVSF
jgi:hypothetical protein